MSKIFPVIPPVLFFGEFSPNDQSLRMLCIVRPMVPENNVPCTYHCLHILSILVEDS